MANKGILKHNNEERDKQLSNNGISTKDLPESIKDVYSVPQESKREVLNNNGENGLKYSYQNKGILRHTYTDEGEYSKKLTEEYGRDLENLNAYTISVVKPSFKVNDYEGTNDYVSYMDEVYGKKESYFSFISKLSGVKEAAENLFLDIVNDNEGKNFADYINEVRKIDDFRYAMEQDAVGIVRNVRPVEALAGVITTNVNKFDGKDTRLGVLSNYYYGRTLVNAAAFNTARNTKYITEELQKTYGLNAANIYDLRPVLSRYVGTNYNDGQYINPFEGAIGDYLKTKITDFRMPSGNGPWMLGYSKDETYFDTVKTGNKWEHNSASQNLKGNEYYSDIDKDFTSEDVSTFKGNTITRLSSQNIQVKDKPNILSKTDELFKKKEIKTILGAYYGGEDIDKKPSLIQSGVSERFGISHGRNLLTKDAYEKGSTISKGGYDNPYCRVWTYHNQYSKMTDLVRPFIEDGKFVSVGELQKNWGIFRTEGAVTKLNEYSVINKNGMVNITPTSDADDGIGIKNCMFSLENLAWVGETQFLTVDQKGPNGGRIMWFPPYDIEFSESVNVNWETFDFIGRGEPLFAYKNTKRSGTLSFTLLVDNPLILDYWMLDKRNNPTDEHEQTALRFFAGCETLDPDEDVIRAMDRKDFNGKLELVEGGEFEKDIIFKTFYPHGYYMDDDASNVDASVKQLEEDKRKNEETIKELEGDIKKLEEDIKELKSIEPKKTAHEEIIQKYDSIIKHIKYSDELIRVLLKAYHEPVELTGGTHNREDKVIKITDAVDWKQNKSLGTRTVNTQKKLGLYKDKNTSTVGLIEEEVSGLTTELENLYKDEIELNKELNESLNNESKYRVNLKEPQKYTDIQTKIKSGKAPSKDFKLGDYVKIGEYEAIKAKYEKRVEDVNKITDKENNLKEKEKQLEGAQSESNNLNNPDNKSDREKVEKIDDLFWYDWYEMCLCPYPDMRKHEGRKYDGSVKIEKVTEIYFKQVKGEVNSTVTTYDFKFRTGEDWTVEVVKNEDGETPSIELSATGGTVGEGTVTLTFKPNETKKPIEHQIKVISGNNERIFKLIQRSADDAKITFDGNSSSVSVDGADKECVVKFKATADWVVEVKDKPDGVSVDKNSGTTKDTEIKVTFPENISNEDKLYTILFKVDKKEKEFIIKQGVNDNVGETDEESNINGPIKFKDNKFSEDIECTGTSYQIEFDAPSKWTATIEPTGKDVIIQPVSGRSRDSKVTVAIPENNDVESKKYVITFECKDEKQKFTLTQKENPAVIFEKSKIEVDAKPKEDSVTAITCEVEFDAKFEWTASIEPTGATLTPSSGESGSNGVEVTIPKNTENIAKEFTLTVKSENKEYKSTILQKGVNGEASTTPIVFENGLSEIALSNTATTCDIKFKAISGWTATAPEGVILTPSSGTSGETLSIKVSGLENKSDKNVKSYVINFKCYEKEQTFTIKQDAQPNIIFESNEPTIDIESTAATCNIPFTATTDWSVSTTDKDIKLYPTSGTSGVSKVKVSNIPGNKSKEYKKYNITFNYGGLTKAYTINQKIVSNIIFTKGNNVTLTSTATTCAIVFDAVDNWTASITPNDKGVKLSTTKGKEGAGQSLEITGFANTTTNKIEYTVTFKCNRKTYDCKIIHLPKSEVKFKDNKSEDGIKNGENEYTIEFTASTAWSASTDSEGVTLTPSSGTSGKTQSIKVSGLKNESDKQKSYIITIICEDKVEHKFTIKQFGKESNETTKAGTYNMRSEPSTIENGGTTEGGETTGGGTTEGGETTGGGTTEGGETTGGGTTEGGETTGGGTTEGGETTGGGTTEGGETTGGGTTEGDGNDEDNSENIGNTTGVWKFKGFLNEKQKDSVEYDNLITLEKFMDGAYEDFPKYATESLKKESKEEEKEGKDDHVPDIDDEIKILAGEVYRLPGDENDDNLGEEDNEENKCNVLTLSKEKDEVNSTIKSTTFTIKTDEKWKTEITQGAGEGVSLNKTEGEGTTKVSFNFPVNNASSVKTYEVKVTVGECSKTFTVTQKGSGVLFENGKNYAEIESTATSYTIKFTASSKWSVSTSDESYTIGPSNGKKGNAEITLKNISENKEITSKEYKVTIECDKKCEVFTVIQKGDGGIIFEGNKASVELDATAVTYEIKFNAKSDWTANSPVGVALTPSSGTSGEAQSIKVKLPENKQTDNVEYKILIVCSKTDYFFTITRKPLPNIIFEGDEGKVDIESTASTCNIPFTATTDWSVSTTDNNIKLGPSSGGVGEHQINVSNISENQDKDTKQYIITFKYGELTKTYTINQKVKTDNNTQVVTYDLRGREGINETNDKTNNNEYKAPDFGDFGDGSTLGEIVNSLKKLHKEIWDIKEKIKKGDKNDNKKQLREELKIKQNEYNSLHDEYEGYITVLKSKVKQKETLEKESEKLSEKISEDEMFLEKIEDVFVGLTEQFGHTKPIYFYKHLPSRSKIVELKVQISFIEDAINRTPNDPHWNDNLDDLVKELESLKEELNDLQEKSKGWGLVEATDAKEAYINYSLQSAFKTYSDYRDAENNYFYEFDEKKICCVVDSASVNYYKITVGELSNQLPYIEVSNKASFKKIGNDIGFLRHNKKYLVKNSDGSILEFEYEDDAVKYMEQNKSYGSEEEFLNSKDCVCIMGGQFTKKELTEITEEEAFESFKQTLADKTAEDIENEFFADKHYNTLKELKEAKRKNAITFGKIQYYFEAQMDYPVYECLEDFIIDCKLKIEYTRDIDAFDEQFGYIKVPKEKTEESQPSQQSSSKTGEESDITSFDEATSSGGETEKDPYDDADVKEEYEYRLYRARLEYKSNENENDGEEEPKVDAKSSPSQTKEGEGATGGDGNASTGGATEGGNTNDGATEGGNTNDGGTTEGGNASTEGEEETKVNNVKYPSEVFDIKNKNRLDLESFGLNTTYELVKKYTGDNDLTCSHAEFFAALCSDEKSSETDKSKYEIYKNRVLKCEEFTLKKNGYEDTEVERLVGEAEKRIEMIKHQLTSKEIQGDMNYKIRKVILNSAISADEEKMGIDKRNEKFKEWLSGNIAALKDKTYETNSKGKTESQDEGETESQVESEITKYMDSYSALEDKKSRNTKVQILFGDFDESKNEAYDPGVIPIEHDVHYGNEQLFFSLLKEQDNIAYQRLVDKVRYFSPAFHSMSPEGFNARLTFLHQCTRQGPTRTISNGSNNANNLAFGRPPICILKLGNFLNTRVIINSMSISYPDSLWDINPEGIGMQFMMAKVQLGIDILGGSDIDGPIRQLQNALSFNYYANTSLYDVGSNVKNSRNTDVKDKENND